MGTFRKDRHVGALALVKGNAGGEGVGGPPSGMREPEAAIWRELAATLPWLTSADRPVLEVACRALLAIRCGESNAAILATAARLLNFLGTSPGARGQLAAIPTSPPGADPLLEAIKAPIGDDGEKGSDES